MFIFVIKLKLRAIDCLLLEYNDNPLYSLGKQKKVLTISQHQQHPHHYQQHHQHTKNSKAMENTSDSNSLNPLLNQMNHFAVDDYQLSASTGSGVSYNASINSASTTFPAKLDASASHSLLPNSNGSLELYQMKRSDRKSKRSLKRKCLSKANLTNSDCNSSDNNVNANNTELLSENDVDGIDSLEGSRRHHKHKKRKKHKKHHHRRNQQEGDGVEAESHLLSSSSMPMHDHNVNNVNVNSNINNINSTCNMHNVNAYNNCEVGSNLSAAFSNTAGIAANHFTANCELQTSTPITNGSNLVDNSINNAHNLRKHRHHARGLQENSSRQRRKTKKKETTLDRIKRTEMINAGKNVCAEEEGEEEKKDDKNKLQNGNSINYYVHQHNFVGDYIEDHNQDDDGNDKEESEEDDKEIKIKTETTVNNHNENGNVSIVKVKSEQFDNSLEDEEEESTSNILSETSDEVN